jgi:hypothetical protein
MDCRLRRIGIQLPAQPDLLPGPNLLRFCVVQRRRPCCLDVFAAGRALYNNCIFEDRLEKSCAAENIGYKDEYLYLRRFFLWVVLFCLYMAVF